MPGRRQTVWTDALVSIFIAEGAQAAVNILASTSVSTSGATLIRTVYDLFWTSETVAGPWGVSHEDYGIGVESVEAFNAAAHPDPNTDGDFPTRGWVLRGRMVSSQSVGGGQIVHRVSGDLHAMRKIDRGTLFFVANHNSIGGTTYTVRVSGLIRSLLLLP